VTKSAACSFFSFLLLFPLMVSAAPLDDYYLSRFAPKTKAVRLSTDSGPVTVHADRCLTPLYRSLKKDWKELQPETQQILAKQVSAPVLAGEAAFPSPGGHFTIHYATSGTDAPDLTDADQDQTPDWVEKVAEVFEQVYQTEVTVLGYRPAPGARYDVYLSDLATQQVYGYTNTFGALAGTSASSYIEIDRAFTSGIYNPSVYSPEQSLQVTAAHEYHHAIQFGYNFYFDIWYAEATATWIEEEVFDSVNQLYGYLHSYLPNTSTLPLDGGLDGGSEYGRWIFNRHLAEAHSPTLIKEIWTKLGTMAAPADESDIPMLPVIDSVLATKGSSIGSEFAGFAKKIYTRQWTTHLGDLSRIPVVAPVASHASYPVSASSVILPRYTAASYKFLPSASAPLDLRLVLSNVATGTDVVALKKGTDGSITSYPLNVQTKTITVPSFNSPQTAEVQLVVTNSSNLNGAQASYTTVWTPKNYTLNLSFAGTGGGSVNGDMSCLSGASCSPAQFVEGTTVTLIPTADANSLFGGWSNACTVIGNACQLSMEQSFTVTATFNASPLLRILGGAGYTLISDAFAAAANDAVIQARAISFDSGTLTFNRPVSVFFKGGYDAGYSSHSGQTTVKGKMVIRDGAVRVDGLVLR